MDWTAIIFILIYVVMSSITAYLYANYTIMKPECAIDDITVAWFGAIWPLSILVLPAAIYDHKH